MQRISRTDLLNTFLTKSIQPSCLPRIKYFGLPIPVTWPVYRNVNDAEPSHGVGLKRSLCKFGMTFTRTQNVEKKSYHDLDFPVIVRSELND